MSDIVFYSFPSCNSSRRVKDWLRLNNVEHTERRIAKDQIDYTEIIDLLKLTKDGFDDIIATKQPTIAQSLLAYEDLPVSKFAKFISDNPTLLKKPILVYKGRLIVGWHKDTYREIAIQTVV